jgi:hypothetical protein
MPRNEQRKDKTNCDGSAKRAKKPSTSGRYPQPKREREDIMGHMIEEGEGMWNVSDLYVPRSFELGPPPSDQPPMPEWPTTVVFLGHQSANATRNAKRKQRRRRAAAAAAKMMSTSEAELDETSTEHGRQS